jgi:hypothetical protein
MEKIIQDSEIAKAYDKLRNFMCDNKDISSDTWLNAILNLIISAYINNHISP